MSLYAIFTKEECSQDYREMTDFFVHDVMTIGACALLDAFESLHLMLTFIRKLAVADKNFVRN